MDKKTKKAVKRLSSRFAFLRKRGAKSLAGTAFPEAVDSLLSALSDKKEKVRATVYYALTQLQKAAVDQLCNVWDENREEELKRIILESGYIATSPLILKIKTALLQGRTIKGKLEEEVANACLLETEKAIVKGASAHILKTEGAPGFERMWELAKENPDVLLANILNKQGRYPADAAERALFYFLAEDMANYHDIDFEQSALRMWYETARPVLKESIARRIRQSGDARLLSVFKTKRGSKKTALNSGEVDLQIEIMAKNKDHSGLFGLLKFATYTQGRRIISELTSAGWICPDPRSHELQQRLENIFQKETTEKLPGSYAHVIYRDFKPMFMGDEKPPKNEKTLLDWTRDQEQFRRRSAALTVIAESGSSVLGDVANTACADDYWQVRMAAAGAELLHPGTLTPANRALLEQDHVYWVQSLLKLPSDGRLSDLGPQGIDALQAGTLTSGPDRKPEKPDNFLDRIKSLLPSTERDYLLTLAEFFSTDVEPSEDISEEAGAMDVEVEFEEE
jgi:hypothetical protein